VDGARDAVVQLVVQLRQRILIINGSIGNVSHCRSLDDVTDDELLDGLILRAASSTVGAADWLNVSASVLVTSVISSLASHFP
jgi:hypothetical protein